MKLGRRRFSGNILFLEHILFSENMYSLNITDVYSLHITDNMYALDIAETFEKSDPCTMGTWVNSFGEMSPELNV